MDRTKVVLVDLQDNPTGEMEKMEAHQKGLLHRAFSVFIFNAKGEMLLQQRAKGKYHGAQLWTNACCSHPQLGENVKESAMERLQYEMGMHCDIEEIFSFIYHTPVENNLIEHEYDHVFFGFSSVAPQPNPAEVGAYKWLDTATIADEMEKNPSAYTYWFRQAFPKVMHSFELYQAKKTVC